MVRLAMGLGLLGGLTMGGLLTAGCEGSCEDKLNCGPQVVADGAGGAMTSPSVGGQGGAGTGGVGGSSGGAGGMPIVVRAIEAAPDATCALVREGETWCWGDHGYGDETSDSPSSVPGVGLELAMGAVHRCRLRVDGVAECWGSNGDGQLGDGTTDHSPLETPVSGIAGVSRIAAGGNNTCAIVGAQTLCWGDNGQQQIPGSMAENVLSPHDIGLNNSDDLTYGRSFGCALRMGDVWCWGSNNLRQADPATNAQVVDTPVRVELGAGDVIDVATSDVFACAVKDDGKVWCWGGVNLAANGGVMPFEVAGIDGVLDIEVSPDSLEVGSSHLCARRRSGELWCWGNGLSGQLGIGTNTNQFDPQLTALSCSAADVALGTLHTCAICDDDSVWCWGSDFKGALGTGGGGDTNLPAEVGPL